MRIGACGVARFETFKFLRKQKKHAGLSLDLLRELSDLALAQRTEQDDQQRQEALARCFETLSASHQKLLQDRYRLNISVAELAKLGNKTERAIYKNLSGIRKMLQDCMRRRLSEVTV